ncbi:MAG: hypothetical protein MHM6MM_002626 [Cercozoa sp. M6MM]
MTHRLLRGAFKFVVDPRPRVLLLPLVAYGLAQTCDFERPALLPERLPPLGEKLTLSREEHTKLWAPRENEEKKAKRKIPVRPKLPDVHSSGPLERKNPSRIAALQCFVDESDVRQRQLRADLQQMLHDVAYTSPELAYLSRVQVHVVDDKRIGILKPHIQLSLDKEDDRVFLLGDYDICVSTEMLNYYGRMQVLSAVMHMVGHVASRTLCQRRGILEAPIEVPFFGEYKVNLLEAASFVALPFFFHALCYRSLERWWKRLQYEAADSAALTLWNVTRLGREATHSYSLLLASVLDSSNSDKWIDRSYNSRFVVFSPAMQNWFWHLDRDIGFWAHRIKRLVHLEEKWGMQKRLPDGTISAWVPPQHVPVEVPKTA